MAVNLICGAVFVLSTVGFINSLYFTLMSYGVLRPDFGLAPPVCRMENSDCQTVMHSRYARVFGLPNSVYGLAFYALVAATCVARRLFGTWLLLPFAVVAALVSVAFSAYLTDALVNRLRRVCVLCFLAHAINLILLVLLAILVLIS